MLAGLSQNTRVILLGAFASTLAFFVFGGLSQTRSQLTPIDAVPRDSFLVATVNLAELSRSPLYLVLLGKENAVLDPRMLGISKLSNACGFDPLSRVQDLAVAVPEEGDRGELGVAARITVSSDELTTCTKALASQRGGKAEIKDVGRFAVIETGSEAASPRLGYSDSFLVVGRGAWFDAMLATADKKQPGIKASEAHAKVRADLTQRPGWAAPTVVVTALLPRSLRDRLKLEMAAEAKDGVSIMGGVLGVSAVGFAVKLGQNSQTVEAALELNCETLDGCVSVEKLLTRKRFEWSKELMYRMVGLGPLLDSIEIKRDNLNLRVTANAPADALAATVDRVIRLSGREERRPHLAPPPPKPDETIKP